MHCSKIQEHFFSTPFFWWIISFELYEFELQTKWIINNIQEIFICKGEYAQLYWLWNLCSSFIPLLQEHGVQKMTDLRRFSYATSWDSFTSFTAHSCTTSAIKPECMLFMHIKKNNQKAACTKVFGHFLFRSVVPKSTIHSCKQEMRKYD